MKYTLVFASLIVLLSVTMFYRNYKRLMIRTNGIEVKAVFKSKNGLLSRGGTPCIFSYGSQEFDGWLGASTYAIMKPGDTFTFYHMPSEPEIFVNGDSFGEYLGMVMSVMILLFGIGFTIYFHYRFQLER